MLNCVKKLADIPDNIHLIVPAVLEPMLMLKKKILCDENPLLCLDEVLNALSICAATDPSAEKCLYQLQELKGCEAHSSHMIPKADESALKNSQYPHLKWGNERLPLKGALLLATPKGVSGFANRSAFGP